VGIPVLPILLVAGSLAFFILEVFIVSFGALTVLAVALGATGAILAFQHSAVYGWSIIGTLTVGIPVALKVAFTVLPKLPFGRNFYLTPPSLTDQQRRAAAPALSELVGSIGTARSMRRPAGQAWFGDRPVDVVTRGTMIPRGARVRVVDVTGNRVVVERVEDAESPA